MTSTPDQTAGQAAAGAAIGETGSIIDLGMPVPGGAFDEHHPPDAALIGDCVHCGFCLPTCPTYVLWGEEMDSPRGRIYLMKEGLEGEPMSEEMVSHWDACLGCMACVTACPSGVQYDRLIEQTRAQVERRHDRSAQGQGAARPDLLAVPAPATAAAASWSAARDAEDRARPGDAPYRPAGADVAPARGDGAARPAARATRAAAAAHPRDRESVGPWSACSPAASRERSSRESTPPPRGCCRPRAATSWSRRAGLLRCTVGAQRPRAGGAGVRAQADRLLRGVRGRARRGERGRLRLHDEGVRRAAGRRPGVRRSGARLRRPGPRRRRDPRRARPGGAAAPAGADRRLPRRLPPRPRPGDPGATAPAARGDPRARAEGDRRGRAVLRLGRHLQHPQPRAGPRARRPQGRQHRGDRRAGAGHRQPRLPDAGHLCHRALRPPDGDGPHRRGARRLDPRHTRLDCAPLVVA